MRLLYRGVGKRYTQSLSGSHLCEGYVCGGCLHRPSFRLSAIGALRNAVKGRRSKLELILDVLEAIMTGTEKPTRIMYEANLSWKLLNEVLSSLTHQDLLDEIDATSTRDRRTSRLYRIMGKGESVVRYYRGVQRLIKVEEPERLARPIS